VSLEAVIEEIRRYLQRGDRAGAEACAAEHPEHAEEIREVWPALVMMEGLAGPSLDGPAGLTVEPGYTTSTLPPPVLGDYRLLRPIGRGGMGVVYEAEQVSLGRRVALKVLPQHLTGDAKRLQRFEREARAAGKLHHTNIVPVFGVGHDRGTHFYIMPLIRGLGLDCVIEELRQLRAGVERACAEPEGAGGMEGDGEDRGLAATQLARTLLAGAGGRDGAGPTATLEVDDREGETGGPGWAESTETVIQPSELSSLNREGSHYWRSVARIGLQAAEALEYAHEQGILHRDIKPSNLLLDLKGTVWVTDFGLAKAMDDDASISQDVVGTVRYMAPERFGGKADARSDVYSLGLTLYELLALRPAFGARNHQHLVCQVTQSSPERLNRVNGAIPQDLVTIVQKAIEREPARRYGTARALGEDLRRYLEGRPIAARRTKALERFGMWCRRNPALAASNITAAVLTTTVAVVSTISSVRLSHSSNALERALENQARLTAQAEADAQRAEVAERAAIERQFAALVSEARASRFSGRQGQRIETLKAVAEANALLARLSLEEAEIARRRDELRDLAIAALALADLQQTTWPDYPGIRDDWVHHAVSPDGTLRGRSDREDGTLVVTRAADDSEVARLPAIGVRRGWMRFSPCNRYLIFGRRDDWFIWTIGDPHEKLVRCPVRAVEVVFSPDGAFLYMLCPEAGQLLRLNCQDGAVGRVYAIPALPDRNCNMALSPGGDRLALVMGAYLSPESEIVRILDLDTGEIVRELDCGASIQSLAWSASGAVLAAGPANGSEVTLWDMTKDPPARLESLNQRREPFVAVAFNSSGTMLACMSNWGNGGLTVYEPNTRRQLLRVAGFFLSGFPGRTPGPNGGDKISANDQRSEASGIQYDIVPGSAFRSLTRTIPGYEVYQSVTIHRNNRLAAGGTIGGAVVWDLATGRQVGELSTGGNVWFEPEGGALWTSDTLGKLRWPIEQTGGTLRIGPPTRFQRISNHDLPVRTSADGRLVALSPGHNIGAIVFPRDHPEQAIRIADGQDIRLLDVTSDGRFVTTEAHTRGNRSLWNATNGELLLDPEQGYVQSPFWREWSRSHDLPPGTKPWQSIPELRGGWRTTPLPDQRLVFVSEGTGRIRIEQIDTERVIARLDAPLEESYRAVAVSPDGGHVLATGNDDPGGVRMWDLRLVRRELAAMGLDWDAPAIPDWPAGEDRAAPLEVEVLTGPILDPGYETKWMLGITERRLAVDPTDAEAHHERGLALASIYRFEEAEAALDRALELRPNDPRTLLARGRVRAMLGRPFEADEGAAFELLAADGDYRARICRGLNNRSWSLCSPRDASAADVRLGLILARQAVRLGSADGAAPISLNTLGVALYRAGQYAEAEGVLARSLSINQGHDAYDLYFLAMARHRLGDVAGAREAFDRADAWVRAHRQRNFSTQFQELESFAREAEEVLSGPAGELPAEVFARD
jgi:serine/threonine protein kinase/WD40 repeat protein